jgi:hypothetical protein
MYGAMPSFPQYAFMAWFSGTILPFTFVDAREMGEVWIVFIWLRI